MINVPSILFNLQFPKVKKGPGNIFYYYNKHGNISVCNLTGGKGKRRDRGGGSYAPLPSQVYSMLYFTPSAQVHSAV